MKTKDAISRLSFTISKGNKPNDSDKAALNALIKFVNKSDEEAVQEHSCFAKLYTLILADFVMHYKDINFANKALNKELSYPLDYHIEVLRLRLKSIEMNEFFKSNGIAEEYIDHDVEKSVIRVKENIDILPKINISEMNEFEEAWDIENVTAHLKRNINESLITYKNV